MSFEPLKIRGPALDKQQTTQKLERQQNLQWLVFMNITEPDFKKSRYGLYSFLFFPTAVRVYFFFVSRGRYMRPLLFYSSLCSSATYFGYSITRDLDEFVKKDTRVTNKALNIILEESLATQRAPDYSELIYERQKKRLADQSKQE